jgi:4'-phosphopantetheinyl transferase
VTAGRVDLWLIRTGLPADQLAGLERVLDPAERDRAATMTHEGDRRRFIATHGVARLIIGTRLGRPPEELRWRHGPHGKPELAGDAAGLEVSLSHSGGLAALALADGRPVGVDIQFRTSGLDPARMSARFYPPAEARFVTSARGRDRQAGRFLRLWTRKEAVVKVAGGRLFPGLRLPVSGRGQVIVPGGGLPPGPCLVRDVPVAAGCYGAVAADGTLPYRVTTHWWPAAG